MNKAESLQDNTLNSFGVISQIDNMYETATSQTSVNNSAAEIFQGGFAPQLTTINQTNTN
ncbi:hypothetical protein ACJJIX_03940 [Microbulbifer sp. VAAC004]|uniref:hypothetical protein n=1 Tax=unclassified Microbulbifer TaxID=2619833 RepID=UPI00403A56CB